MKEKQLFFIHAEFLTCGISFLRREDPPLHDGLAMWRHYLALVFKINISCFVSMQVCAFFFFKYRTPFECQHRRKARSHARSRCFWPPVSNTIGPTVHQTQREPGAAFRSTSWPPESSVSRPWGVSALRTHARRILQPPPVYVVHWRSNKVMGTEEDTVSEGPLSCLL